jgi:hypothetical protein
VSTTCTATRQRVRAAPDTVPLGLLGHVSPHGKSR